MKKSIIFNLYKIIVKTFNKTKLRRFVWIDKLNNSLRTKLKPNYIYTKKYNHKMYLDEIDSLHLSVHQDWEPFETNLIEKLVQKGDIVLDIGANIGFYTLILSKLVGKKGKVYAFEADPSNFKLLKKNIEVNNCENVILINKAVSNKKEDVNFYIKDSNTGGNSMFKGVGVEELKVKAINLDEYFSDNIKIDFIKMDIEGAEGRAVIGMKKLLEKNNIKLITEYFPTQLDGIGEEIGLNSEGYLKLLENVGFNLYDINENKKRLIKTSPEEIIKKYKGAFTNLYCEKIK